MDITVQTGQTKAINDGTILVPLSFTSHNGEHVCLLLQIDAEPHDAKTLERECTAIVRGALLETEGDAGDRLDGTLKELNGLFKGLLLSSALKEIHAILAITDADGNLNVSHAGRAEAYIVRSGAASQITEFTKGKPSPAFVHIASGALEAKDVVIFSTQRLLRALTPAQMAQLVGRGGHSMEELVMTLESEREQAALAVITVGGRGIVAVDEKEERQASRPAKAAAPRGVGRSRRASGTAAMAGVAMQRAGAIMRNVADPEKIAAAKETLQRGATSFLRDLKDPARKRRAHLLLLAGVLAIFVIVWAVVNVSHFSQTSKTRGELEALMEQIETEMQTAENRHISGDVDSANAILQRAEERAKQVMENESGLFRVEANTILGRIRAKHEEINNIVRLAPRVVANLAAKTPEIVTQGLIGLADGEFAVFDRQDLYRVLLNTVDDPDRISEEDLLLLGTNFSRFQTLVFQTNGNSVIETISGLPTTMKTEDPAGWITGRDMEAYLRFLYILSPENNQIYKYERLSNRYGPPAGYNVNGDLKGALDMVIDGNVFILKDDGNIVKLLRGETQAFVIRHLPSEGLTGATKLFKVADGNLYVLDPTRNRILVATDGGPTGESAYLRQFVLEGADVGMLKDLYVDPDQTRLYVLDEKRLYAIDLGTR